jgi:hypothetical protein
MFADCRSLTSLDLSGFSFTENCKIRNMCAGCDSLCEVILSDTIYNVRRDPKDDLSKALGLSGQVSIKVVPHRGKRREEGKR